MGTGLLKRGRHGMGRSRSVFCSLWIPYHRDFVRFARQSALLPCVLCPQNGPHFSTLLCQLGHVPFIAFCARAGLQSDNLAKLLHNKFLAIVALNGIGFAATITIALTSWHLFENQFLKLKDLSFLRREEAPSGGVPAAS